MSAHPAFFFVPALLSFSFAVATLLRENKGASQRLLVAGLLALAVESALSGFAELASLSADKDLFRSARIWVRALLPSLWLSFSLAYSRGNAAYFLTHWKYVLAAALVGPLGLGLAQQEHFLVPGGRFGQVRYGWPALLIIGLVLISSVLTITNLERTYTASLGTMRWRIKFVFLGAVTIFGTRIYTTSQTLLFRAEFDYLQVLDAGALLVGVVFFFRAFGRGGLSKVDVYPSEKFLESSVTGLLAGGYLFVIGVLARVVTWMGGDDAFAFKALMVIAALAGLAMLLLSDRLRQRLRDALARNLGRPRYDYRSIWLSLTGRTVSLFEPRPISAAVAACVSETLSALSVSVWLINENRSRFECFASTCFSRESDIPNRPLNESEIISRLALYSEPFLADQNREAWAALLDPYFLDQFKERGGSRVCVPLHAASSLIGMITLGDRVNGTSYGREELDLLKCVADQFASNLRNVQLSAKLVQAKEMEAFQTVSAFFVHDLKNTASTLGLMLQNFQAHIDKPEFREDALRAIGKATGHIRQLIERLSAVRGQLSLNLQAVDLNDVIRLSADFLKPRTLVLLRFEPQPLPRVSGDSEQLQKVFTNLFLNAAEAMNGSGEIEVAACRQNGSVVVSVLDRGCGMSAEFIENQLFRPFQSTKKGGLGIGMFHSKMIVEAHRGRLEVDSRPGEGTTFRVFIPLSASADAHAPLPSA